MVATDLHAAIEANQGHYAFEMAEAGVEIARARLAEDPDLADWSSGELRMEGTDEGSVVTIIERDDSFLAVSTGWFGNARRKIEASLSTADGEPRLLAWRELYR